MIKTPSCKNMKKGSSNMITAHRAGCNMYLGSRHRFAIRSHAEKKTTAKNEVFNKKQDNIIIIDSSYLRKDRKSPMATGEGFYQRAAI